MRKYMQDNVDNIINCRDFEEKSISGTHEDHVYKIYSYTTPIAFCSGDGTWYLTTKKYSQTTDSQLHALRVMLSDKHVVSSTPEMFELRLRGLKGLASR